MAERTAECPVCHGEIGVTRAGTLFAHGPFGRRCAGSALYAGTPVAGFFEPERGQRVLVTDVGGRRHQRVALGPPVRGANMMVTWVCREDAWEAAGRGGRMPEGVPWPSEDVHPPEAGDA